MGGLDRIIDNQIDGIGRLTRMLAEMLADRSVAEEDRMGSLPQLTARGFGLAVSDRERVACPVGTRCSLSGEEIDFGYRIADIVSAAQGEWWETFNGNPFGYLSEAAAACWLASNPKRDMRMSKSFAVFGDAAYEPMVSQKSADAQGRPSWRDLVRTAWERHRGEPCALVLSSDTKKRVWWRGRSGTLGGNTPVLIYDTGQVGLFEVRMIDWPAMLGSLELVEAAYAGGFYQGDVATTLMQNITACERIGWAAVVEMERSLGAARRSDHWPFVRLIARGVDTSGARL